MGLFRRKKQESGPEPPLGAPIIMIGRKELFECGFEFCGPAISDAFAQSGLTIALDDQRDPPGHVELDDDQIIRWLWVNEQFLVEDIDVDVEFRLADGQVGVANALDWDLIMALRAGFEDPSDPDRNWQLGSVDEGYLLILARPDELDAIGAHPQFVGYGVSDLTGAAEIRRGQLDG